MGFWDDHEKAEQEHAKAELAKLPPSAQNDCSGTCEFCGRDSDDVLVGVCAECAPR